MSSIVWDVIGPERMFGAGALTRISTRFWLVGAALPVLAWLITRHVNWKSDACVMYTFRSSLGAMGVAASSWRLLSLPRA